MERSAQDTLSRRSNASLLADRRVSRQSGRNAAHQRRVRESHSRKYRRHGWALHALFPQLRSGRVQPADNQLDTPRWTAYTSNMEVGVIQRTLLIASFLAILIHTPQVALG